MPQKSEGDLKALLAAAKTAAMSGSDASTLASERATALNYYLGDVSEDLPGVDGRSKAVSTDVSDTVEGLMPSLMEIFCGSDEVVKFEPVGPEDVAVAEQETDYVNHVFTQQNPGFLILYSFVKDALLSKVGIVKVLADKGEKEERQTFTDLDEQTFTILVSKPGIEVEEHTAHPDDSYQPDPANPDAPAPMLHDVTIVCKKPYTKARVEPVPPEEFGIARRARSIKDADYCFHEVTRTQDDLISQGFDAQQVRELPSYSQPNKIEARDRDTVNESSEHGGDQALNEAIREIRVTEHYVRMDYKGDGKARLYRVTTGGEQGDILLRDGVPDVVEEEMIPFAAMTPVIMTHRFFGRSIADLVMDIQRIKTVLMRALLDNAYLANNPRVEVPETAIGDSTLDDLLVSRPGGVVRTKVSGQLQWQEVPTIGNHVFPLIEYQDLQKETRTGVTRQGQGIDADALQNQSATAVTQLYSASQARIKLIARIFAETGIKDMFWLLHATIRKHGKKAETVRLRNKWVTVDPQQFQCRDDLTVNVGLGSGGKSERMAQIMALIGLQKEALANGLPIVGPKHLYNSGLEFLKLIELKAHESFMVDPDSDEGKQLEQKASQRPNPEVAKLEMQGKLKGEEMQMNAQLQERADQRKAEIEGVQAQADIATNQQKMAAETAQKEREHELKVQLALLQHELDREKMARDEARKDREHEAKIQAMREGHQQKSEFAAQSHAMSVSERMAAAEQGAAE